MTYDSVEDTLAHIDKVRDYLGRAINNLSDRGVKHDESKLSGIEKEAFDIISPILAETTYGSDEYKAALREMKPAIQEHYKKNNHHPEHYTDGISGMSLFDLIEMLCDWKAASERMRTKDGHNGGHPTMLDSLDYNIKRFEIDSQLASILNNTIREMGWL